LVGNNYRSASASVYDLDHRVGFHFEELNKLSPFILLTKDDIPSEDDFQICKSGNDLAEESIMKDLNHPNARVREMAHELLNDIHIATKSGS
jgi:hypothetical protein